MIFIITLIILFSVYMIAGYFSFRFAFRWVKPKTTDSLDETAHNGLGEYIDLLKEKYKKYSDLKPETVSIKSFDGLTLYGKYFDAKSDTTLLLVHGYHSSDANDFSNCFEFYRSFGFNILLLVQRSHRPSEGKYITFGIKERYDVKSWLEYINKRVENGKIIIGSVSMGTATTLMATELDLPSNIKCIIADCGYTSPSEIILKVADDMKLPGKLLMPVINFYCRVLGGFSLDESSAEGALRTNEIPVMFIHGDADTFVPYEMSKRNYKANKGEKKLLIIKDANHALSYVKEKNTVETQVSEFIKNHLD